MIYSLPIRFDIPIQNTSGQYPNRFPQTNGYDNNGVRVTNLVGYENGDFLNDDIDYLVKNSILYSIKTQCIPEECHLCKNVSSCKGGMRCLSFLSNKNKFIKDINCTN